MTINSQILISSQIDDFDLADEKLAELKKLIKIILDRELEETEEHPDCLEVSLTFVDDDRIEKLNKEYRDRQKPTDVLAFPLGEELLGEVIISIPRARDQAEDYNHSLFYEISFLTVHGVLHLLGYEHGDFETRSDMEDKEKSYLSELESFSE